MRRIGLFTFFQTNYGAALQAYALQSYLQTLPNTRVEIIDFTAPGHYRIFKKPGSRNPIKIAAYYLLSLMRYGQLKRRMTRTACFQNQYLSLTKRFISIDEILKNHPQEDFYFTGSDQVFNPNSKHFSVFYLGFDKGRGKKVAYAPSFGISVFDDSITQRISPYLADFDSLSCRESLGRNYLESVIGKSVPVVCDPVFLHDSEEWNKIAVDPKIKGDYIFIYDLNGKENLIKIARKIRKKTGLPIVCLTVDRLKFYPVDKQIYDAGPAEFVGWIKNASFVVTDSFHGTSFSLIYRKPFFAFIALEKTSERLRNILGMSKLEDRLLTPDTIDTFVFDQKQPYLPDWENLGRFIELSKQYIDVALC